MDFDGLECYPHPVTIVINLGVDPLDLFVEYWTYRVNKNRVTLIDHIYTNTWCSNNNTGILSGILYTDISDHFPIFAVLKDKIYEPPVQSKCRIFNKRNMDSFISKLTEIDWSPITQNNAYQDAYTSKNMTNVFH